MLFALARPQQYRTLKESDPDGDEMISPEKESDSMTEQEQPNTDINLLDDIFSNIGVESQPPLLSQAKSLEDLRTPKEDHEDHFTFDYQVCKQFMLLTGKINYNVL